MTDNEKPVPPSPLSQERQDLIVEALSAVGVEITPCRFCKSEDRVIFEVNENLTLRALKYPETLYLPYILIVCNRCGHKSEFSIDALGI